MRYLMDLEDAKSSKSGRGFPMDKAKEILEEFAASPDQELEVVCLQNSDMAKVRMAFYTHHWSVPKEERIVCYRARTIGKTITFYKEAYQCGTS